MGCQIAVVGIGLDGAVGLAPAVLRQVEAATLLVGGDRHLAYFPDHPAPKLALGDLSGAIAALQRFLAQHAHSEAIDPGDALESSRSESCHSEPLAVVLTSGDPLFFGLGRLLLEQLPAAALRFYPHLSAVQLAFSAIKQPWQDATLVSVHGRSLEALIQQLKRCPRKLAILTDGEHHPGAIAQLLLDLELPIHYRCYVCENLGGPTEKVYSGPPERFLRRESVLDLALESKTSLPHNFASLNVMVLVQVEWLDRPDLSNSADLRPTDWPRIGIPDGAFATFDDRPGLMTKREVRTLALAELALAENQVVWDIGAGTGSVSIEIARLCPSSRVYAIEKTAAGMGLIGRNCDRFRVSNIQAVRGAAPDALADLPDPDRIFIGGSGGHLSEILAVCGARLRANGCLVLAIATLENLAIAQAWLRQRGWRVRLMQAQFLRGVAIAAQASGGISAQTRWTPLNPVSLLTAERGLG
ncbi:MAG: precorrin-6y C5,15-methyltransferase (decarboxylating) subunit CbiE [Synechococcales cyanobacterium CRU_2_2]|nr:precorrin-6y C5,15-methyltransferase (decarboxylating) subunit CbiE [Synechococcales cyanobacterium CRU_2_2]